MTANRMTIEPREFRDEKTGRTVWQVTDGPFECVAAYMECCVWSDDDRYMVLACNREGTWQPYRLELATGEFRRLADVDGGSFRSINVDPLRGEAYCWSGDGFLAVNIESLETRQAVDFAAFGELSRKGGGKGAAPILNPDASKVLVPGATWQKLSDPPGCAVTASTDGSNDFEVVPITHPLLADYYIGHVNFCPADDAVISFCKSHKDNVWDDGQWHHSREPHPERFMRAREYRVDARTGDVCELVNAGDGCRATHCVWGRSGDRIYFHRKSVPDWVPTALCSVDREGGDFRVHYETDAYRLGHSSPSPDEAWLVTDSQDPDENILMLAHTQRDEQHMLCWPNMSITSDRPHKRSPDLPPHPDRHTHPGFSCTGRYVHYTSDISGRSQVYVVPVDDLV